MENQSEEVSRWRQYRVIAVALAKWLFLKVTNLMASPKSLIHPIISLRVLLGNILQIGIAGVAKYRRNSNGQIYSDQL